MSFYAYKNSQLSMCPGPLNGSLGDLKEKVCVQVKKVYDSCMQQEQLDIKGVHFTDIHPVVTNTCTSPGNLTMPLTLVSCRSTSIRGELCNLCVEPLPDRCNFARVRVTVAIPIEGTFEDACGQCAVGKAVIQVPKDVILYVPDESIIPYCVESLVSAICVSGTQCSECVFNISLCVTVILKILAEVELLIPSYGFCQVPPCEEFAENVCDEFFSLPLFPPQPGQNTCNPAPCNNNCACPPTIQPR
ncbi:MAG: hypothetical protein ACOYJA_02775 [Christensenellales bacterium]